MKSAPVLAENSSRIRRYSARNSGGSGSSARSSVSSWISVAKVITPSGPDRVSQSTNAARSGTPPGAPGCERIGVRSVSRNRAAQRRSSAPTVAPSAVRRSRASRRSRSARSRSAPPPAPADSRRASAPSSHTLTAPRSTGSWSNRRDG
ncbi:hypothetical protein [Streptomyces sp. NBC_01435]|uniref:hypothetical protein n=1 Tax=Streptomyces sp. NBC_01435 TaxID=2903865 RepID=UPI002E37A9B0|nr:hypothetical protein [Streptomyces sp. NBC_01435]